MSVKLEDAQPLVEGTAPPVLAYATDPITPAAAVDELVPVDIEAIRQKMTFDWRTRDPETIRGEGPGVEAMRYYREKIEDLLRDYEGQYVLISDREILAACPNIEAAVAAVTGNYPNRQVFIIKVVAIGQIHSLGGVVY